MDGSGQPSLTRRLKRARVHRTLQPDGTPFRVSRRWFEDLPA
jgi:hypothetical protein